MTKFYRETQFKDTEIGRIPEDWEVVRLGKVVQVRNGERPKMKSDGKIPVYGANGIVGWTDKFNVFQEITLIIGRVGASGKVQLATSKIWVTDNALYLTPKMSNLNLDMVYLYYVLHVSQDTLKRFESQSTHSLITQRALKNLPIPLPPIEEQRAIAGVLRQFDELVEVIDNKIESLQRIKKGLMDVYFTRGVFEHREFKETEIGRIPEDWEVVRLGKFIKEFVRGVSYTKSESALKNKGGFIPLLRATNLGDEKLIMENLIYVIANQVNSKQLIRKGDIVITTSSGSKYMVGRAIRVREEIKEPIAIGAFLAILRFNDAIDNEFAYYIFKSHIYRRYLNILVAGTNINNLKREYIYNFTIPLPPIEEQKEIARRLKDVDDQIENLREQRESVERMKKRVMDLLLTGKVRVKEV